jgi:hypothetical protein
MTLGDAGLETEVETGKGLPRTFIVICLLRSGLDPDALSPRGSALSFATAHQGGTSANAKSAEPAGITTYCLPSSSKVMAAE